MENNEDDPEPPMRGFLAVGWISSSRVSSCERVGRSIVILFLPLFAFGAGRVRPANASLEPEAVTLDDR